MAGIGLTLLLLLAAFSTGAEAGTSSNHVVRVPDGSTRYATMTISAEPAWGCPRINAVVQVRLKSVNSRGFTVDGMRVYDGSGHGVAITSVQTGSGAYAPWPGTHTAKPWRWGKWNNSYNDRLSWREPNVSITVTTAGKPWYCSRARALTVYRA